MPTDKHESVCQFVLGDVGYTVAATQEPERSDTSHLENPMNSLRRTAWATIFLMASTACAEPNDSAARLQGLPRPWDKRVHRLKPDEYKETLRYWAEKHRDILEVNQPGASVEGEPIYLLKITDPSVPDDNKQIIVIAAMHGGPERCGTTTLMHLAQWLLSDETEAVDTRRQQVVRALIIRPPNAGGDPTWDSYGMRCHYSSG